LLLVLILIFRRARGQQSQKKLKSEMSGYSSGQPAPISSRTEIPETEYQGYQSTGFPSEQQDAEMPSTPSSLLVGANPALSGSERYQQCEGTQFDNLEIMSIQDDVVPLAMAVLLPQPSDVHSFCE
jgi:hypothetical protein